MGNWHISDHPNIRFWEILRKRS